MSAVFPLRSALIIAAALAERNDRSALHAAVHR
jgi:hypothetical protein